MNDAQPATAHDKLNIVGERKPWFKPAAVILPVDQTETFANTGNDGAGSTTGS